mgnify:FL=1
MVLGAGLALLAPDLLREAAVSFLVTCMLVHGVGMTLKYRLEQVQREPVWWEATLFWLCWGGLAALGIWLLLRTLAP